MSSKFAARLVRDEPAEVISNNPGWLLQVQRHKSSEFVVPFVSCHRKSNPASIQIGNLAGFCKSMQNSAEAAGQREPPVNPQQNATSGNGLLRNASKCSETFRNALARMTYCLGHPAIVASNGPVGNDYPFCKSMQSSA
jgi:hypothetical protein